MVGSLGVIGDVAKDIDLTLVNASQIPVALSTSKNGTSVLVLTEALDREGMLGAAGLAVDLLCTKRNSTQPGYTIPISIRSLIILSESFPSINSLFLTSQTYITM